MRRGPERAPEGPPNNTDHREKTTIEVALRLTVMPPKAAVTESTFSQATSDASIFSFFLSEVENGKRSDG